MIRRATPADHAWITRLAADVYIELGDYGQIIPSWLLHPGVISYLDEGVGPRGFILLGFYEPNNERGCVADLLAIAVSPEHQRRGIGRRLLDHAIDVAQIIGAKNGASEIRLTVAEPNRGGRRLFASAGFTVLDADHGLYDGGQRAIRMRRGLELAPLVRA